MPSLDTQLREAGEHSSSRRRQHARPRRIVRWALLALTAVSVGAVGLVLGSGGSITGLFESAPATATPPLLSSEERKPLPDRTLQGFAGGPPVELADYQGLRLLVNFWASWCVPCVEEMPVLQQVSQEAQGQVAFLGINVQDAPSIAASFIEEVGVTYDQASDPTAEFFTEVGGFGMPMTLLVDASGTIVYRQTGAVDAQQLRALLRRYLGAEI